MSDDENEKTDLEKVGLFRDGPYDTDVTLERLDIRSVMGRDPDVKDDPLRLDGPFPIIPGPKLVAATNDWPFSPYIPMSSEDIEDPYQDPGSWRRKARAEAAEKNIGDEPFVSMVGARSMNGLGTYYGTFIKPEDMPAVDPAEKDKKDDDLKGLPNFLTSPGKKGSGYGYLDITINPYPTRDDGDEDPYFDLMEARKANREAHEAAIVGDAIWVPGGQAPGYFNPNPYLDENDPDGTEPTYDFDRLVEEKGELLGGPWIPASTTKVIDGNKDVVQPLERFPEWEEDPYEDIPLNLFRTTKKAEDEDKPPWRPNHKHKTRQVRSVISYNVGLRVNSTNFHRYC